MSLQTFPLPTLPNFAEFLYFPSIILPHEIQAIDQLWNQEMSMKASLSDGGERHEEQLRKSSVIGLTPSPKTQWIFDRMTMIALQCNNERYGFALNGFYEPFQLAEYGEGDFFDWHLDFGVGENSNRKLSISVQLSDPSTYEGGTLQFMINNKTIDAPREQGTIIIFPSFIMHRVTPVTKGKRRSIVAWVSGPPYR